MTSEQQEKFIDYIYRNAKHIVDEFIQNDKIDVSEYPHTKPILANIQDSDFESGRYAVYLKILEKLECYEEIEN